MISLEIIVLLVVVGGAFGIPLLVRSMVYPRRMQFDKAASGEFEQTPFHKEFHDKSATIIGEGFSGGDILEVHSIPHPNFTRFFLHQDGTVMLLSVITQTGSEERRYFRECFTVFSDGFTLSTRSVHSFDTFTPPADAAIFSYSRIENVKTLLTIHRKLVGTFEEPAIHVKRYGSLEHAIRDYQAFQNRMLDFQVETGLLREVEDEDTLRASWRIIPSIVRQNLRLFDRDIAPNSRFRGIIIGMIVLAALAVLNQQPDTLMQIADRFGRLFLGFFMGSAAFLIGMPFRRNAISWALISLSTSLLYIVLAWPPLRLHIFDFVLVIMGAGWLGSRATFFHDMEDGRKNLVSPLVCVLAALAIILISG